jgi:phosphoribosylglycinamide formyltransferase-1
MGEPLKIAVLASGEGTNLQAIIDAIKEGRLKAEIKAVISNNSGSGALRRAKEEGLFGLHLSHRQFATPEEFNHNLLKILRDREVELIVLAGYMKMLSPKVINAYRDRILNIHPALLPSFGGKGMYGQRVHQAVIDYGVKLTGVTVHIVDEKYDHGPIVLQRAVKVLEGDDPESLSKRVLEVEHKLYPEAIRFFAEERIRVEGRRVKIGGKGSGRG